MLTKDQANTAAEALLSTHKERSRWSLFQVNQPAPARKWAPLGMVIGMSVGIIASMFVTGRATPGMGLGMFAGALAGTCVDHRVRPGFLAAIASLLGLGGLLLWYFTKAFVL